MKRIAVEQVRTEVLRWWKAFNTGALDMLDELYSQEASVFSPAGERSEHGRIAIVRRKREYAKAKIKAQPGNIEVALFDDVAIAYYTFTSEVIGALNHTPAARSYTIHSGRATQVFALEADGKLRIIHEHISIAVPLV